ncbi:MAG: diguanylate cyclase [Polyangiaceae bacterium]|nr:diguanylate cyclase [Polyangiaceae bacterium]
MSVKVKVLVVDDSAAERTHIVQLLQGRGYDVVEAATAFEALGVAGRERPDVVVLDVVLGELDGRGVCRMLRLSDMGNDLAIVMLTVKGHVKYRTEGLRVGADDYMPKPFDPDELDARISAAHRARAGRRQLNRQNADLAGRLAETKTRDDLTGVLSRRRFLELLPGEWARATRDRRPLSCALVDVDRFKQFNDRLGDAMGDDVLRRVAELVRGNLRNIDLAARFGGDEFALLLPDTPVAKACGALERLRGRLQADWTTRSFSAAVTLSVGIASSEDETITSPGNLIRAADRALYVAKRDGRDRIAVAEPFRRAKQEYLN